MSRTNQALSKSWLNALYARRLRGGARLVYCSESIWLCRGGAHAVKLQSSGPQNGLPAREA
jgi:hypothetical protein